MEFCYWWKCGRIAVRHSDLLGNNQIKNAKLVAVCDIHKDKAEKISRKFNIPFYMSYNKMINDPEILMLNYSNTKWNAF